MQNIAWNLSQSSTVSSVTTVLLKPAYDSRLMQFLTQHDCFFMFLIIF